MGSELRYTLGLATAPFLGPLTQAAGALTAFVGVAGGVSGAVAAVFAQIEKGGALKDLSARTGESVRNLFSLEHASKQSGVPASELGMMLLRVQSAMGGVNEAGEPTSKVFQQIGLDIDKLRDKNAPTQIQLIANALAGLDRAGAANAASKIFGRGGTGSILQIARDWKDFGLSIKEASGLAALFARNADAFDRIGDTLGSIKLKVVGLFAGVAEGAAPGIQAIVDSINGIPFERIGKELGKVIGVFTEAFKGGEIGELIHLSIAAGAEKAADAVTSLLGNPKLWEGIAEGAAGLLDSIEKGIEQKHPILTALLFGQIRALEGFGKAGQLLQNNAGRFVMAGGGMVPAGERPEGDLAKGAGLLVGAVKDAFGGPAGPFAVQFAALVDRIAGRIPGGAEALAAGGGRFTLPSIGKGKFGSGDSADALTRIGFFSGGTSYTDVTHSILRRIATASEGAYMIARQRARQVNPADQFQFRNNP